VAFFDVSFFVSFLLVEAARLLWAGAEMVNKSERRRRVNAKRVGVRLIKVICKGLSSLKNFRVYVFAVRFPHELRKMAARIEHPRRVGPPFERLS
jgi:hypothetical protein